MKDSVAQRNEDGGGKDEGAELGDRRVLNKLWGRDGQVWWELRVQFTATSSVLKIQETGPKIPYPFEERAKS